MYLNLIIAPAIKKYSKLDRTVVMLLLKFINFHTAFCNYLIVWKV